MPRGSCTSYFAHPSLSLPSLLTVHDDDDPCSLSIAMPIERRCSLSMAVSPQEDVQQSAAKACQHCHRIISTSTAGDAFNSAAPFAGIGNYCAECRLSVHPLSPFELSENRRVSPPAVSREAQYSGGREVDVPRRLLRRPDENDAQEEEEVVGDEIMDSDVEMNREESQPDDISSPHSQHTVARSTGQLSVSIPFHTPVQQHPTRYTPRDFSPASSPSRFSHPPRSPVRTRACSPIPYSGHRQRTKGSGNDGYPDPLADISRIRVRSKGHKCLYPGARFEGTQKSGRNSYEVNVSIVDVDFAASYLCGYLCIKGLTEDWPELTTYFDAQIIGDRYGFVTDEWGASEQEDMVHWSRFPAFGTVKADAKGPMMLLPHNTSRSAIFMRWKEHFLVPDHKVDDINGASFAGEPSIPLHSNFVSLTFYEGFYYICIDVAPPPRTRTSQQVATGVEGPFSSLPVPTQTHSVPTYDSSPPSRLPTTNANRGSCRLMECNEEYSATMTGFYFHQNSEP